jgi:hypothetical protein
VQIWGGAAADFTARMSAYETLRRKLEEGLPKLEVTSKPAEIVRAENLLAARIRKAPAGARRGDILSALPQLPPDVYYRFLGRAWFCTTPGRM